MKLMNRLEQKFGRYAISNLSLYIILCYVIGYALMMISRVTGINLLSYLYLIPYAVCRGQIWRLFTWVLIPPSEFSIFTIIMLLFYYSIGTSLERTIGAFRYNVFIFGGAILTVIGMMATYGIGLLLGLKGVLWIAETSGATTYYLCMSIFLLYALFYPNMQVLLYFVIPVKISWMAILDVILLGFSFITGGVGTKVVIGLAFLNLLLFFLTYKSFRYLSPGEIKRRKAYQKQVQPPKKGTVTRHKCAVCGRTELDGDDLVFRFCTKCNGNYEYCQDHMFTHEHVK